MFSLNVLWSLCPFPPANARFAAAARFSFALMLPFSAHCCSRCCTLLQEIHELKDQIQDVEIKYTQNLKEVKVSARVWLRSFTGITDKSSSDKTVEKPQNMSLSCCGRFLVTNTGANM